MNFEDLSNQPSNKTSNKTTKLLIVGVSIVILFILVIAFFKLTSKPSVSANLTELLEKPFSIDNNIQNSINSKLLGVTDQYIFYASQDGLYRINKDGSSKTQLDTGSISNINVYQGNIYYSKSPASDGSISNRNTTVQIVKQSFDGKNKTDILSYECQRISSILLVNDVILYTPVVFVPDGKSNDGGEPSGALDSKLMAATLDGSENTQLPDDTYEKKYMMSYPYTQSAIDSHLRDGYPDVVVKTSRYAIGNKMYFEVHSTVDPKYVSIFSLNKDGDTLKQVMRYDPPVVNDVTSTLYLNGFAYSDNGIYYILTERRRVPGGLEEKFDLYRLDTNSDESRIIETIFKTPGF